MTRSTIIRFIASTRRFWMDHEWRHKKLSVEPRLRTSNIVICCSCPHIKNLVCQPESRKKLKKSLFLCRIWSTMREKTLNELRHNVGSDRATHATFNIATLIQFQFHKSRATERNSSTWDAGSVYDSLNIWVCRFEMSTSPKSILLAQMAMMTMIMTKTAAVNVWNETFFFRKSNGAHWKAPKESQH